MAKLTKKFQRNGSIGLTVKGSKAVKEMIYDGNRSVLYVTFADKRQYKIANVTKDSFAYGRSEAKSLGRWVNGLCQRKGATRVR